MQATDFLYKTFTITYLISVLELQKSREFMNVFYRGKKPQPDNFEGIAAGKLVKVSDPIGLTLEGLQVSYKTAICEFIVCNCSSKKPGMARRSLHGRLEQSLQRRSQVA